jgi:hypothetical protein
VVSSRRWIRVACVSYDDDYETYSGRLSRSQRHPILQTREEALRAARREIQSIEKLGFEARIWAPLHRHKDSGHVHVVALLKRSQVRRFFPTEDYVRKHGAS